jgi:hypothetical protein
MKKNKATVGESDMRTEYDFRGGTRGKHVDRYSRGSNIIVLDPDVAEVFPDSKAVNEALRLLAKLAGRQAGKAPE